MNVPLSRHLASFAVVPPPPPLPVLAIVPPPAAEPMVVMTAAALDRKLADTRQAALDEAGDAHAQALADLVADQSARRDEVLATARADWLAAEAGTAAAHFDTAFAGFRDLMAERLADTLAPLLAEASVQRTRAALLEAIDLILADPQHPALTVRGPSDLVAALVAARGDRPGIEFIVAETPEASVSADGMRIETRLGDALATLANLES